MRLVSYRRVTVMASCLMYSKLIETTAFAADYPFWFESVVVRVLHSPEARSNGRENRQEAVFRAAILP